MQLPAGVIGVHGVFLKTSKILVETVAALIVKAVAVVAEMVVVVEVRGRPSIREVDHVAATLSSQGGLSAGRGNRLAV